MNSEATTKQPEKYYPLVIGKYLLLLLIPLIGFGIYQIMNRKDSDKKSINELTFLEKGLQLFTATTLGTFTDNRDGQTYKWVRLKDGKKWMAQNLKYQMTDTWCYDDESNNCATYGRLYSWEAAQKACPSGWRLPSDKEWRKMAKHYGGCDDDAQDGGQAAYAALIQGGRSGFSALLGGYKFSTEDFYDLDTRGYYWSSTERSATFIWHYRLNQYHEKFYRSVGSKSWACACRCLRD
ncbi:MAG: FISUMP domain-containing protein [Bacteroidota bacterium]